MSKFEQTDKQAPADHGCGECVWWESMKQPSGTGQCQLLKVQKDETDLCGCTDSRSGAWMFTRKIKGRVQEGFCPKCRMPIDLPHECPLGGVAIYPPEHKALVDHVPSLEQGAAAARKHRLFVHFRKFAAEHEIDVDGEPEDWYDWWQCWFDGAQASAGVITDLIVNT